MTGPGVLNTPNPPCWNFWGSAGLIPLWRSAGSFVFCKNRHLCDRSKKIWWLTAGCGRIENDCSWFPSVVVLSLILRLVCGGLQIREILGWRCLRMMVSMTRCRSRWCHSSILGWSRPTARSLRTILFINWSRLLWGSGSGERFYKNTNIQLYSSVSNPHRA